MSGDLAVDLILAFLCFGLAGIIAAAETAILSAPKSALEDVAANGDARAVLALHLKEKSDAVIAASQITATLLVVFASALCGSDIFGYLQPTLMSFGFPLAQGAGSFAALLVGAFIVGGCVLVIGSLVPKSLGLKHALSVSMKVAKPYSVLLTLMYIPQLGLTAIANVLLKPFKDATTFSEPQLSEEAIMTMIEKGTESGIIDQTEHDLIESIFQFTSTTVKEIMVPRTAIVGIDAAMRPEDILKMIVEEGYTRMPVFRRSLDDILGVVYAKDVVSLIEHRDVIILHDIMRPIMFVPESKNISELLREFQKRKSHLAIVVDEFGGTEGLITMEDILEEIVGEIHDEYDEDVKLIERCSDGSYIVDGSMNVTEFNRQTEVHIPESDEYDTVAGFVTKVAERIPHAGEQYEAHGLRIGILSLDDRRVEKILLRRVDQDEPLETETHPNG